MVMISILFSISAGYGLSPQVKYKWTRSIGGSQDDWIYGLATDPAGSVYLTGYFQGTVDFGRSFNMTDIKTVTNAAGFITKINSTGAYGWTRTIPVWGNDIAADASGNIYVVGGFRGTVDFGLDFGVTDTKTSTGFQGDGFITKVNSDGSYGWTLAKDHGENYDVPAAVAVDPVGNIYVTGHDWPEWPGPPGNHIFIDKLYPDGSVAWSRLFGTSGRNYGSGYGITSDGAGNILVKGHFLGTVNFGAPFGTTDIRTSTQYSGFILKISVDGTYGWTRTMGADSSSSHGRAIAADAPGNALVTGFFSDTVDFGSDFGTPDSKTSAGDIDIFIMKVRPDGAYGWTKVMGGSGTEQGPDLAVDGLGNLYLSGSFENSVDFGADFGVTDSKTSASLLAPHRL